MKKYLWGLLYSLGLAAFTVYLLLDTFVIARVYVPVPEEVPETKVTGEMLDIGIGVQRSDDFWVGLYTYSTFS